MKTCSSCKEEIGGNVKRRRSARLRGPALAVVCMFAAAFKGSQ